MPEKKKKVSKTKKELPKKRTTKPKKRVLKKGRALELEKKEAVTAAPPVIKEEKKPSLEKKPLFARKFVYAVGRRKEAQAATRLFSGTGKITVNNKDYKQYFPTFELWQTVESPLVLVGQKDKCDVEASVRGGGKRGQAEAIRLGLSRCLKMRNPMFRAPLKKADFLTRDAREKERKKYGLKGARRAPQWQKR